MCHAQEPVARLAEAGRLLPAAIRSPDAGPGTRAGARRAPSTARWRACRGPKGPALHPVRYPFLRPLRSVCAALRSFFSGVCGF